MGGVELTHPGVAQGGASRGSRTFSGAFRIQGGIELCMCCRGGHRFSSKDLSPGILDHLQDCQCVGQGGNGQGKNVRAVCTLTCGGQRHSLRQGQQESPSPAVQGRWDTVTGKKPQNQLPLPDMGSATIYLLTQSCSGP